MEDLIVVCEKKEYKNEVQLFKEYLNITRIDIKENIEISDLRNYKVIVFMLNPFNIIDKYFLRGIEEILKIRKSGKSIIFCINELEKIQNDEVIKVSLSLENALEKFITNPNIEFISSKWATVYKQFNEGILCLEDIQKLKNFFILDEDEYSISGKEIREQNLKDLHIKSKINTFKSNIQKKINSINNLGIDVTKNNILLCGHEGIGKGLLKESLLHNNKNLNITEVRSVSNIDYKIYDSILVILDFNKERNEEILEEVCENCLEIRKIFIVNKIDEYMYFGKPKHILEEEVSEQVKRYSNGSIYFISMYYLDKLFKYERGEIILKDIISDNNLVFIDEEDIPVVKVKQEEIIDKLKKQGKIKQFNKCLGEIRC